MAKEEATLLITIKKAGTKTLDVIKKGLGGIAGAAKVAGAALVAGLGASLAAYKEQEKAINSMNQSLVQQGIFTPQLSKKYQELASSLQKVTTFGDENIISAQGQLQAYLGQEEVTEDLLKATLDFASAMKVDLKTAADLVGKTVGSSTNALSRYGVEIDTSLSASEKLAAVTESLGGKFGGQAEAATKGLGALDQLKNTMGDILEVIGSAFAPFIGAAATNLDTLGQKAQTSVGFLSNLAGVAKFVAQTFVFLKNTIAGLGEVIGTGLAAAVESVTLLTQGQFSKAKEIATMGMDELGTIVKDRKEVLNEELNEIDALQAEQQEEKRQEELMLLQQAALNKELLKKKAQSTEITEAQKHQAKMLGLEIKGAKTSAKAEAMINKAKENARAGSLSTISSLQSSSNKQLAGIGKAAAITQIAIAAPQGVSKALAAFPPPINFVAAGAVAAAFAAQAAQVAGVKLAEGGIVNPTAGGTSAIIGEAGRAEAVVPLPDDFDPDEGGGVTGGGNTFNFTGPVMGDQESARKFAVMIDEELLGLRQRNESVAFDEGTF